MISVGELINDPDLTAPEPFTVLRSTGQWVAGGFQTNTTIVQMFGPAQQASNKEIQMLPEADRVGSVRAFWATVPLYTTRGYAAVPGTHGEAPQGSGTAYTLSTAPPAEAGWLYVNGLLQTPNVDYTLVGTTLTLSAQPAAGSSIWFEWPITMQVGLAASDIIQYGVEQYRVLQVYKDFGSGYWKALATRMAGA